MKPIIEIRDLYFKYPGDENYAINGLSLDIPEGSFSVVLGHNGSGKSTLAKHLNGILLPTSGSVAVCGIDTRDEERLFDLRSSVGMVFQNPDNQIVSSIVEEDVAFAPENLGLPSEEIRKRVDKALRLVGMYDYRLHSPHLLSGGQKQRVAIAGVLAMEPKVLVLDEPTAMLDPVGRREVIETLIKLCRETGISVVLITHHMYETVSSDLVFVMSDGKLFTKGSPAEVFSKVEAMKAEGLTVPDTTELINQLIKAGMSLPLGAVSAYDCALAIASALKKRYFTLPF